MNVMLVSQCTKGALKQSRRILDQFGERRGTNTWQTAITNEGLRTLRKLLRKTARKNTSIACHWIRRKNHSELMWIVGDAGRFNEQGTVPTNKTRRDVLRVASENDWRTGEDIQLLAQMAGLLHDLGKASVAFQERLTGKRKEKNIYRHEWVSLRLFLAFVGEDSDEAWLKRLADPTTLDDKTWLAPSRFKRDGLDKNASPPFKQLPPLAAAIAWLVLTHHRLPVKPSHDVDGKQNWLGKKVSSFDSGSIPNLLGTVEHDWNERSVESEKKLALPYWSFENDLPVVLPKWRKRASLLTKRLLALSRVTGKGDWLNNPYVMHLARMVLMLADHSYSALIRDSTERVEGEENYSIFANTDKDGSLKQPLDEHLLGVARLAGTISWSLPGFENHLPRLARHRGLKKRSADLRFRWQDKAFDCAAGLREKAADQGAFVINMASTGCGKTLANARIAYALADPQQGMRVTYALGLRTLTLQTGRSYRENLHLGDDELAIKVGGAASRALFDYYEKLAAGSGSESIQELLEEDSSVLYEGQQADHALLAKAMADQRINSLLSAPVLVCTIDHLTPATEAQRAGRQIAPMLRLMSSDLILDELDDFDLKDLPALTRLVHWAGLLGSRVVLSSATLPPSLLEGMFLSYWAGRREFLRNRGPHDVHEIIPEIPCLWVDEFNSRGEFCAGGDSFNSAHEEFIERRVNALKALLKKKGSPRFARLWPLEISAKEQQKIRLAFAEEVQKAMLQGHNDHNETCPQTGKRISFGLVRMANIDPLFEVARQLFRLGAPENYRIHLCVYHSRFPLLLRSAIEHELDTVLNRRQPQAVYENALVQKALVQGPEENHLFVVLGSPVTEVGRDHDYDWAVVEPSSMRSLIQLAGRVQRHRLKDCETPNIFIFDTNLRHFSGLIGKDGKPAPAFVYPGFEDEKGFVGDDFRLLSHRLKTLIHENDYRHITARPRIQPRARDSWEPQRNLVDLEHSRLSAQMLPEESLPKSDRFTKRRLPLNAASVWQHLQSSLTWILPQQQPFRADVLKETELVFLPDESEDKFVIHSIFETARRGSPAIYTSAEKRIDHLKLELGLRVQPWVQTDFLEQLKVQAIEQHQSLSECAKSFTAVTVPESSTGWQYNQVLGLVKKS
mgnify:CR=1 FL=1